MKKEYQIPTIEINRIDALTQICVDSRLGTEPGDQTPPWHSAARKLYF